jgi:putative membrane protein
VAKIRISESDKGRIKAAVHAAEMRTSGEIVPLLVASSGDYSWVHWLWALGGWLVASVVAWVLTARSPWALSVPETLFSQCIGMGVGFILAGIPWIKRRSLPRPMVAHQVHQRCLADFVALGLHQTKHRTGILIYLSKFERRVEILADSGIHAKTSEGYWQSHVDKIVAGLQSGTQVDVLCEVIRVIGEKLAEHFPRHSGDVNELSDEVRIGHPDEEK